MTKFDDIQALLADELTQSFKSSFLASKANTPRRSEAVMGLRAAANLAVGINRTVSVEVKSPLRDSTITVDGHAMTIGFLFGY